jgi:hypothetical protein
VDIHRSTFGRPPDKDPVRRRSLAWFFARNDVRDRVELRNTQHDQVCSAVCTENLCVSKTLNPTIVVMQSTEDAA